MVKFIFQFIASGSNWIRQVALSELANNVVKEPLPLVQEELVELLSVFFG